MNYSRLNYSRHLFLAINSMANIDTHTPPGGPKMQKAKQVHEISQGEAAATA